MPAIEKVKHIKFKSSIDDRGILTSIEAFQDIPIDILRVFYMHRITKERGGHAHIDTDQVVIPVSGNFNVDIFDGNRSISFNLDDATTGLYIPRLLFTELYNFTSDAVCLVLANTHYDIKKSLRTREDYLNYIKQLSND